MYLNWSDCSSILFGLTGQTLLLLWPASQSHIFINRLARKGGGRIVERWFRAELLLPLPLPSRKLSEMALYLLLNNCYCRRTFGEGSQKSTPQLQLPPSNPKYLLHLRFKQRFFNRKYHTLIFGNDLGPLLPRPERFSVFSIIVGIYIYF